MYARQTPPAPPRAHSIAALAVALLCFAAYVALLAPGPYWLDSSEFAAAAFGLGIAHPPGHPLAALLGKAFALVPLGSVALRVGLSQAACGAAAAGLVTLLGAELARRAGEAIRGGAAGEGSPWIEAIGGAAAGLGFGWSHAAAMQAVRPEVYALHAMLALYAVLMLARFDRDGDPRRLLLASLALGLGLANHHFLTGLLGLPALLYVASQYGRLGVPGIVRTLLLAIAAGLLGVAVYGYLPVRALAHPAVDWGAPSTLSRFVWTVSARAFQKALHRAELGGAGEVAFALLRELGALAPFSLLGAWVALRLRPLRPLALLLLGAALLDAAGPALVGFDRDNPDAYGYLEPAVALCVVFAAVAPAALAALVTRRAAPRLFALALAALAAVTGITRLPALSLARFDDTARVAGALLDECPPRALLVTSYFQTVFPLWYLRSVEGRRPDLDHVHRHFLAWPGYAEDVLHAHPDLAPLLTARDVDPAALLALAAERPVRLEYDLDLDPALAAHLVPGVLTDALAPGGAAAAASQNQSSLARARMRLDAALDLDQPETRRFAFWRAFLDASRDCAAGRVSEGNRAIERARALLGGVPDPDLEELARRCAR